MTRGEGRADQPQEPRIFLGAIRERLLAPPVVAARIDLNKAAHDLYGELLVMRVDTSVRRAHSPGTPSRGHRCRPP